MELVIIIGIYLFVKFFFNSETTAEGEILISSVTITSNEYASMKRKYGANND
jgi:hypothetical protein